MIDISNVVVRIVKGVLSDLPEVEVVSTVIDDLEHLPTVVITEKDNNMDLSTADSEGAEHTSFVTYDVNIYVSKVDGSREFAKEIFTRINDELVKFNFVRTFKGELPNVDRSVFRLTGTFRARVSEDLVRGSDTINLIYRR